MRWRRTIDYHGSRAYAADRPRTRRFSAIMRWLAQLVGSNGRTAPRETVSLPLANGHRGYSLLGASRATSQTKAPDCPFPLKAGSLEGRDWRLLP